MLSACHHVAAVHACVLVVLHEGVVMDEVRVEAIARKLREDRASGLGSVELARTARDELGEDFRPFRFIQVFWRAFDIPLPVMQKAAAWRGLNPAPPEISDAEFEQLLAPWLSTPPPHCGDK